jgi:hypothetical protein
LRVEELPGEYRAEIVIYDDIVNYYYEKVQLYQTYIGYRIFCRPWRCDVEL